MSDLSDAAAGVDAAIDALDVAVAAYLSQTRAGNAEHVITRNQPHPRLERAPEFVRAAVGSKLNLAQCLGIGPTNPTVTVAGNHPE